MSLAKSLILILILVQTILTQMILIQKRMEKVGAVKVKVKTSRRASRKDSPKPDRDWETTSEDGGVLDEAEAKKLERIVSRDLLTAKQTHANIGRGSLGAEIDSRIEDISKAEEIDWRTLLRRHIVEATLNKDDYTWSRPNRRFIGEGTYFPSPYGLVVER